MPNWCENKLVLKGNPSRLACFLKVHLDKSGNLDFNTIIPEPKTLKEAKLHYPDCVIPRGKFDSAHITVTRGKWFDWYEFHCNHWGTKWNACDTSINESISSLNKLASQNVSETILEIYFNTAWSPCIPIINKLINMYPDLIQRCSFFEGGNLFAGYIDSAGVHDCDSSEIIPFVKDEFDYDFDEDDEEDDDYDYE